MKRQHQVVVLTLGVAAGIIVAANSPIAAPWQIAVLAMIVVVGAAFFAKRLTALSLIPLSVFGGILYFQLWHHNVTTHSVANLIGQNVSMSGQVVGTPFWDSDGQYVLTLTHLSVNGQPYSGTIRVKSLLSNAQEGYTIATSGKLYHTAAKADAQIIYADTQIISMQQPWLVRVKNNFDNGLTNALPKPANQFMEGIILGNRSGLPTDIQDELNRIGLAHIIAVSGYNLTILIIILHKTMCTKWKWLLMISSLWMIVGFVLLTGAVASIVRAGVMSGLFVVFHYYGKRLSAAYALALTALITILINPAYLLSDLGWQLSFAALAGIVFFADPIKQLLPKRLPLLSEIIAVTLAAQILTIPLIAFTFGQLSLIAPLSNLLIMPFIPLLMAVGLAAGFVGMIFPNMASIIFAPLNVLVRWLLELVSYLANLHFAALDIARPSLLLLLSYYGVVLGAMLIRWLPHHSLRYNKLQKEV